MTPILDRLVKCGVPGLPSLADYNIGFTRYAGNRLFDARWATEPPDDKLWASLADMRAWEKNDPASDNDEDGCFELLGQRIDLRLYHGLSTDWNVLDRWVDKTDRLQLKQPICEQFVVGGWAQWWSPVRRELSFLKDTLENHVSYDDETYMERVQALALAVLAYTDAGWYPQAARCTNIAENAIRRAMADADRNEGLGNFHHLRTHAILDARQHEPGVVSTDATASYQYMLCLMWAITGIDMYRRKAVEWAGKLEKMRTGDKFYPFVRRKWALTGMKWEPIGHRHDDYALVPPAEAFSGLYEKNADGSLKRDENGQPIPIVGLPPTDAPQKLLDRCAAARKG